MSGPRWIFLRGLVRESGHWAGFLERFGAAFPDAHIVAIDLPGNGARFRERSPPSIAGLAEAAHAALPPWDGETRLFALSLGGMVALEWLRRWPGEVTGAVLVNTSLRGLSPFRHRLRPRNYGRILRLALGGDFAVAERTILAMTSHRPERFDELTHAWAELRRCHPVARTNALRQLLAAARFRPPLGRPGVPVLVLNGAGDQLVNPACSQAIARAWELPLRVHPTAGHDLTLDEPDWVLEQLRVSFPGFK